MADTRCKLKKIKVKGQEFQLSRCQYASQIVYTAKQQDEFAGTLKLSVDERRGSFNVIVSAVTVATKYQSMRLGTRLYEQALKDGCKLGYSVISDDMRSEFSEAFWRKQVRKKRATCALEGSGGYYAIPKRALEKELARGEVSQERFNKIVANLPEPALELGMFDAKYPYWPCEYYKMDDACKTKSLAGLPKPSTSSKAKRKRST